MKAYPSIQVVITLILFLSGCMAFDQMRQVEKFFAIGGKYLLHNNPQAGDYATYRMYGKVKFPDAPDEYYYEKDKTVSIQKIVNSEVFIREDEIATTVTNLTTGQKEYSGYAARLMSPIPRRIVTDMEGTIKRIYTIQSYQFKKLPVAVSGDDGFITWTPVDKKVRVSVSSQTFTTQPVWFKKASRMNLGSPLVQVNTTQNTWETNYINPEIKFLTTMNLTTVITKMGMNLSWSELALMMVNSLTATNIFSNPAMYARDFAKQGMTGFIKSTAKTAGKNTLNAMAPNNGENNLYDEDMGMTSSFYLVKHGNTLKDGVPLRVQQHYPEPAEFQ
ncbi:MAG TPA: hypothetical protein PK544_18955 [Spirochaetota bacterium]|nr:hypothetical protein [Spirochaetota bacterium]